MRSLSLLGCHSNIKNVDRISKLYQIFVFLPSSMGSIRVIFVLKTNFFLYYFQSPGWWRPGTSTMIWKMVNQLCSKSGLHFLKNQRGALYSCFIFPIFYIMFPFQMKCVFWDADLAFICMQNIVLFCVIEQAYSRYFWKLTYCCSMHLFLGTKTNLSILDFSLSPTQSIGMLSYTFLRNTGKEDIIVPIVSLTF